MRSLRFEKLNNPAALRAAGLLYNYDMKLDSNWKLIGAAILVPILGILFTIILLAVLPASFPGLLLNSPTLQIIFYGGLFIVSFTIVLLVCRKPVQVPKSKVAKYFGIIFAFWYIPSLLGGINSMNLTTAIAFPLLGYILPYVLLPDN